MAVRGGDELVLAVGAVDEALAHEGCGPVRCRGIRGCPDGRRDEVEGRAHRRSVRQDTVAWRHRAWVEREGATVCPHQPTGGRAIATLTDRLLTAAVIATKVATIGFGIDAWRHHDSARLRGKAIRTRAIGYTAALFLVPIGWRLLPDRDRYPLGLDLAVTAPLLADAAGNAFGIYNEAHVDDVVHGANAAILAAVAGSLLEPHLDAPWQAAIAGAGVAVAGEALWEVMEYVAMRMGQDGMHLTYEDTMEDMLATWFGAAAGALVTLARATDRTRVGA